ncbi:VOC family protein [Paraburkholderia sediminicola]|uniref:VOC family protein n=1 Tax=Paraburkholderia sediminicola TaxID=458836 RepID=UPI0038BACF6B
MLKFQPNGWHTITPRIVVRDPKSLIDFLKTVFDAQGEFRTNLPTEIRIGDSVVMISDGGGLRGSMPAFLYVYVDDTDSTYKRAMTTTDVTSLEEPSDMPYGDRRAMIKDRWGNTWQIAPTNTIHRLPGWATPQIFS